MVGYITASIKNVADTRVGDTVTDDDHPCGEPLPGYKKVNPWSTAACIRGWSQVRGSAGRPGKAAASTTPPCSMNRKPRRLWASDSAADFWDFCTWRSFRSGWSGSTTWISSPTAPSVIYKIHKTDGTCMDLTNPSNMPDPSEIDYMEEPMVKAEIMVTTEFIGPIMQLCEERRGQYQGMEYMEQTQGGSSLSPAPQRDHLRFLRRPEIPFPGLCLLRL